MSATSALRRTLLEASTRTLARPTATTTTAITTTNTALKTAPRLSPVASRLSSFTLNSQLLSRRQFSISAKMSDQGVHNLLNKPDFDQALNGKGQLMVLDCFATWCGPCKIIAPKVVEMSHKYTGVNFYKIDVDEVPEVAQELSIRAMPTFVLFKDGQKVADVVGANPVALEAAIQQHM